MNGKRVTFVPDSADFYCEANGQGVYEHPYANVYWTTDDCEENVFMFDNPADALCHAFGVDHVDKLPADVKMLA